MKRKPRMCDTEIAETKELLTFMYKRWKIPPGVIHTISSLAWEIDRLYYYMKHSMDNCQWWDPELFDKLSLEMHGYDSHRMVRFMEGKVLIDEVNDWPMKWYYKIWISGWNQGTADATNKKYRKYKISLQVQHADHNRNFTEKLTCEDYTYNHPRFDEKEDEVEVGNVKRFGGECTFPLDALIMAGQFVSDIRNERRRRFDDKLDSWDIWEGYYYSWSSPITDPDLMLGWPVKYEETDLSVVSKEQKKKWWFIRFKERFKKRSDVPDDKTAGICE